jgi:glc operon protein GlcG
MKALIVAIIAASAVAGPARALESKPVLSLELAQQMAKAALANQVAGKFPAVNVVIVDDGGNIILVNRQDGACKQCGAIATNKARTAALMDDTTRHLELKAYGKAKDGVGAEMPGIAFIDGVVSFPGGLPVRVNGVTIGGVGVSGASGDQDEGAAKAAIQAFDVAVKK